jgi:hypothetical protein
LAHNPAQLVGTAMVVVVVVVIVGLPASSM